jgi:hypothetical protein
MDCLQPRAGVDSFCSRLASSKSTVKEHIEAQVILADSQLPTTDPSEPTTAAAALIRYVRSYQLVYQYIPATWLRRLAETAHSCMPTYTLSIVQTLCLMPYAIATASSPVLPGWAAAHSHC